MFDNNTINPFIDQIVNTIDSMFEDKDIPTTLKNYLYLACTGMILNYGLEYIKDIYTSINKTRFIYGLKDIQDKLSNEELQSLQTKLNSTNHAYTLSKINTRYDNDQQRMLSIDYTLIIEDTNSHQNQLLEYIIHELNHILTSMKRTFQYREDGIYFRYGLFLSKVSSYEEERTETGRTLNEVINTLQSEDIMRELIKLKKYDIANPKFKVALSQIEQTNSEEYKCNGYEPLVNLYRTLYSNPEFKSFINHCILEGDITSIEEEFNHTLGYNSYSKMNDKLEVLQEEYLVSRRDIRNVYRTSTLYLQLKNRFIKEYLNRKNKNIFVQ